MGKSMKSILLIGSAGCGKTTIEKVTADLLEVAEKTLKFLYVIV